MTGQHIDACRERQRDKVLADVGAQPEAERDVYRRGVQAVLSRLNTYEAELLVAADKRDWEYATTMFGVDLTRHNRLTAGILSVEEWLEADAAAPRDGLALVRRTQAVPAGDWMPVTSDRA